MMNTPLRTTLVTLASALALTSCASSNGEIQSDPGVPVYDVDPQVIYRIDDHRYVTMENYPSCTFQANKKDGRNVYYHDDKLGIKQVIPGSTFPNFKGRLVIDSPLKGNLAFPGALARQCSSDRACPVGAAFSSDQGRSWSGFTYEQYAMSNDSQGYTFVVTDEGVYVANQWWRPGDPVVRWHLSPKKQWTFETAQIPLDLRTLSDGHHVTCDSNIKPRSVKYVPRDSLPKEGQ